MQLTLPRTILTALGTLLLSATLCAHATETPAALDGATVVSSDQVKKMLDAGTPVIDARVANEYVEGHIKGAKNVPYKEKSAKATNFDASQDNFDLTKLPADKNASLVFYCNAGECWKSYKASIAALKAGYKKVFWFRGGFPEWKAKGYPVE
ncbi:rhodanese-like domain-containing protein [Noviherbaspirillum sp. UKPF54]|uniref:rhodanese-like domain-containing protein n=1 Tax=Noviherbaspirillum sp. UKPF54 TaxID=2601898 RepID=UPI0011B1686E|nr:rhodanese-like domain-containing protein [Noviherbaspirillum sp. UKPF54]QDZ29730.1 rhodanese [Noviherbaspirillum sp. UKPF54]